MKLRLPAVCLFICVLILFVYKKCDTLDRMLLCSDCQQTHCTSENAFWAFLIFSLPIILFLQYLLDNNPETSQRQIRYVYNGPVTINMPAI
jgi:hypothetical protein